MYKDVNFMARMDNGHEFYNIELAYSIDTSQPLSAEDIVEIVKVFERGTRAKCVYFQVADIEFLEAIEGGYIEYNEETSETIYLDGRYKYVDWSVSEGEIADAFSSVADDEGEDC